MAKHECRTQNIMDGGKQVGRGGVLGIWGGLGIPIELGKYTRVAEERPLWRRVRPEETSSRVRGHSGGYTEPEAGVDEQTRGGQGKLGG